MIDRRRRARALSGMAVGLPAWIAAAGLAQAAPVLAPGIEPAPDMVPSSTRYVVANTTPLYRAPAYDPAQVTGETLKRGEHPQILGEANMGVYLLVGRDGKGVGYVPRSLLCPADLCPDIKG